MLLVSLAFSSYVHFLSWYIYGRLVNFIGYPTSNGVMAMNDKSKASVTNVKILFVGFGILPQICCYG
jgi:hypothetical protein